jgi:prepilin-type N-terminal cleavage/methylation domain-containing protein
MRTYTVSRHGRPSFTLIELLVVLAIITLLVALTSAAVMKFIGLQQSNNTYTGLKMLKLKSDTQWQAVTEKASADPSVQASNWIQYWMSNNAGQLPTAARAAYVQVLQTQAFPQNFYEALNPDPNTPAASGVQIAAWSAYVNFLQSLGVTAATVQPPNQVPPGPNEGAICLIMALTIGPNNSGATVDSFGSANVAKIPIAPNSKVLADGAIDGWGTPLGVQRNATNPATNMVVPSLTLTSAGPDRTLNTADDIVTYNLQQ